MRRFDSVTGGLVLLCLGKSMLIVFARTFDLLPDVAGSVAELATQECGCRAWCSADTSDLLQAGCVPGRSFLALAVRLRRSRTDLAGLVPAGSFLRFRRYLCQGSWRL